MEALAVLEEYCGRDISGEHTEEIEDRISEAVTDILDYAKTSDGKSECTEEGVHLRVWKLAQRYVEVISKNPAAAFTNHGSLLLRMLRNMCANNRVVQNQLRESDASPVVLDLLHVLSKRVSESEEDEDQELLVRSAVTFLINFATANEANQSLLWEQLNSSEEGLTLLYRLVSLEDATTVGNVCLLIHNLTGNSSARRSWLFADSKSMRVLIHSVNADNEAFQWIYFIMQNMLKDDALEDVYNSLSPGEDKMSDEQFSLLNVLDGVLAETESDGRKTSMNDLVKPNTCKLIGRVFYEFYSLSMQQMFKNTEGKEEIGEVSTSDRGPEVTRMLLEIIGNITSSKQVIQTDFRAIFLQENVLRVAVSLLDQVWKREQQTDTKEKDLPKSDLPAFSIKHELIRIIGNMCCSHIPCQDEVRKLEGIPLLLNQCRVDERHPFAMQWALLAIKHVCEGNEANKDVIRGLKMEGVASNPELAELGLQASFHNGKIKVSQVDF
eukprot:TRINITY_DN9627_c0_g1_i3.p1 TRINITY_DN9627_c0_g1~~TRINITY_DN9627_c0_g1_i3.p1  ORF type:complete len:496 (+),score=125.63 TRINITY_DN9627_c0_g1_i3:83-1570(+)